jgi:ribonuclease III
MFVLRRRRTTFTLYGFTLHGVRRMEQNQAFDEGIGKRPEQLQRNKKRVGCRCMGAEDLRKSKVIFKVKDIGSSSLRSGPPALKYSTDVHARDGTALGEESNLKDGEKLTSRELSPADFAHFEQLFNHKFADQSLLQTALTHRSLQALGERGHYERLEFLGDAVLDLAIAELLIAQHPQASEGQLSKMRAALVNTGSLAEIAKDLELGKSIRLSRGEIAAGGAERSSILADVTEAIFGALFSEVGYAETKVVVKKIFGNRIQDVSPSDPKTELQERLHVICRKTPVYKIECTEGPEHAPIFVSIVLVDGEVLGRGKGVTKKLSQQAAAAQALAGLEQTASSK